MAAPPTTSSTTKRHMPRPDVDDQPRGALERTLVAVFVIIPFFVVLALIPLAWGWGLGWHDIVIGVVMYQVSGMGVTIGFHRYFTHGSFKAKRGTRIGLAIAGSLSVEGDVIQWVADHRRHHKYSDREGDPHSPWRYGDDWRALTKGLIYSHIGWMLAKERTSKEKYAPDLVADADIRRVGKAFGPLVAFSMLAPAAIGWLWTGGWQGALAAFFWGTLVRIVLLHHVTWSVNSICHTFGVEEFEVRDKSRNVWWLALLSMGESWHNMHHSDPTCARHGVLKGQIDESARVIWVFEKLGWVYDVRWPKPERLAAKRVRSTAGTAG